MRVLLVDENRSVGSLLQNRLAPSRAPDGSAFEIEMETDYGAARAKLRDGRRYDAVIIETSTASAADGVGQEMIAALKGKPTLALVLTALPSYDDCVAAMRAGAWDYVPKMGSINQIAQRLIDAFERAVRERAVPDPSALYVEEHFARLSEELAGQWIAIGDGRFLASAATEKDLSEIVKKMPVANPTFLLMPPRQERS